MSEDEAPDSAKHLVVSATVVTQDQSKAARVVEVLARASTGLALEGLSISITMGTAIEVDDDD